MKGLLVGVSFAVQTVVRISGNISFIKQWDGETIVSVISCGSVYLFFNSFFGLAGFVLYIALAKKYKYKEMTVTSVKWRKKRSIVVILKDQVMVNLMICKMNIVVSIGHVHAWSV